MLYKLCIVIIASFPGPFPAFQRATLKSWEWAWERGCDDSNKGSVLNSWCVESEMVRVPLTCYVVIQARTLGGGVGSDEPPFFGHLACRNALREPKFPKFSGGAYPQTPLGRLWA